jgi:hypothetical protein
MGESMDLPIHRLKSLRAIDNFLEETIEEEINNIKEQLKDELKSAIDDEIDELADIRFEEKLKAIGETYVYDWFRPQIYARPEFREYSREELPEIIHVVNVKVMGLKESVIRDLIAKHKAHARPGQLFSPPYWNIRVVDYLSGYHKEKGDELEHRPMTMYITRGGKCFSSEDIETIGIPEITKRMKEFRVPISRSVYENICYSNQEEMAEIFEFPGDTNELMRLRWLVNDSMKLAFQVYKAEQLVKEADSKMDEANLKLSQAEILVVTQTIDNESREVNYQQRMIALEAQEAEYRERIAALYAKEAEYQEHTTTIEAQEDEFENGMEYLDEKEDEYKERIKKLESKEMQMVLCRSVVRQFISQIAGVIVECNDLMPEKGEDFAKLGMRLDHVTTELMNLDINISEKEEE